MIFIFLYLIIIFFISYSNGNTTASIEPLDNNIIRVDENIYVGKKKIPFKNKDGSVDVNGDEVYFVFEKLTKKNISFWIEYNDRQEIETRRNGVISDVGIGNRKTTKRVQLNDGVASFRLSLEQEGKLKSDIWIAYITRKNPASGLPINFADIEMIISVFLNADSPITTHMGISRNYEYFLYDKNPHLELAMELHAFCAKVSNQIYGSKLYMVTKPVVDMEKIIIKVFEKQGLDKFIWAGDIKQRNNRQKEREKIGHDEVGLKTFNRINAECSPYFPENLSDMPPFDNSDHLSWRVLLNDGGWERFRRPDWFPAVNAEGENIADLTEMNCFMDTVILVLVFQPLLLTSKRFHHCGICLLQKKQ